MSNAGAATQKARAEVDNLIDEVVLTIESGVSHPDGRPGFEAREAEQLKGRLRAFAEAIMAAARDNTGSDLDASVDEVVATIRNGVIQPEHGGGFGAGEAKELRDDLRMFADAVVAAARKQTREHIDASIRQVVRTIRSGLFHVYGRGSYAAITADQLEAYLETFVDAVLAVVEKTSSSGTTPVATQGAAPG